jgi:hypothetical protein
MIPAKPAIPQTQRASGTFPLRFEDLAQDGRLLLDAATVAFGVSIWNTLMGDHPLRPWMTKNGVVPILSRLAIEGAPGPFSVAATMTSHGEFELAHARDAHGEVARIFLNMWADISGPIGLTRGPKPANRGDVTAAARVFAEHSFTRLFAPPHERKVVRFDVPGFPAVPEHRYEPRPFAEMLALPAGARALDEMALDPIEIAFGLCHTDANQHVNSLVYPRMFEEAALRRFADVGRSSAFLSRSLEIAYRKPFFAGERARISLRVFEHEGKLGACGVFLSVVDAHDLATAKPHAYVQTIFEK